jgi:hypothetical protein
MKNLKTFENFFNNVELYVDVNKIRQKDTSKFLRGDKIVAKCRDFNWAKKLTDAWNRRNNLEKSIKNSFDKVFVEENLIKQKPIPSDLFLQFGGTKKIAKCINNDWAKKLTDAWNNSL